jgi:hypothetical protein
VAADVSETCEFCGEGRTEAKGDPMYYEAEDIHAHMDCAIEAGVGLE